MNPPEDLSLGEGNYGGIHGINSVDEGDVDGTPNITTNTTIGNPMKQNKESGTTRVYFINVNGIQFGAEGGDMNDICRQMQESNIDVIGAAEIHLDTTLPHVNTTMNRCVRKVLGRQSKLLMSSSRRSYGTPHKPGGTLLLSQGSILGRWKDGGKDDMGRWTYSSYRGSQGRLITIISAYQVCKDNPHLDTSTHRTKRKYSASIQQYSMMRAKGIPPHQTSTDPIPFRSG